MNDRVRANDKAHSLGRDFVLLLFQLSRESRTSALAIGKIFHSTLTISMFDGHCFFVYVFSNSKRKTSNSGFDVFINVPLRR